MYFVACNEGEMVLTFLLTERIRSAAVKVGGGGVLVGGATVE